MTVLAFGSQRELYGLPADPVVPRAVQLWKGALKSVGNVAIVGGLFAAAIHFIRYGRKHVASAADSQETVGGGA